jgi:hypothetical protein
MNRKGLRLLAGLVVLFAASVVPVRASTVDLTFAGVAPYPSSNNVLIENYYNGGTSSIGTSGTNYGISFSDNALDLCLNSLMTSCSNTSKGGLGDPNSQVNALYWLSGADAYMDDPAGFTTGFSFTYSDPFTPGASISVYSGVDGTGSLLATLSLPLTTSNCPGYGAGYCPFVPIGVTFSGTAESIDFGGTADYVVFDDVTIGSATPGPPTGVTPEPSNLLLFGTGLLAVAGAIRRKIRV